MDRGRAGLNSKVERLRAGQEKIEKCAAHRHDTTVRVQSDASRVGKTLQRHRLQQLSLIALKGDSKDRAWEGEAQEPITHSVGGHVAGPPIPTQSLEAGGTRYHTFWGSNAGFSKGARIRKEDVTLGINHHGVGTLKTT